MKKFFLLVQFFTLSFLGFTQIGKEPIRITDMLKIKSIGGVDLSKDGSKIVYNVTSIEPEGESKVEYKYVNQIWIANADGSGSPKQLTTKENSTQASFSPDGKQIVFVRSVDGRGQIFLLSLDGGEAVQLTKYKYGAGNPRWSPDGKQLLFSASIPLKDLLKDSLLNPGRT
jgi:Tol biopolymer transport system component